MRFPANQPPPTDMAGELVCPDEVLPLLKRDQLSPQLIRDILIDRAIESVSCTEAERQIAIEQFCQQQGITSPESRDRWLTHRDLTIDDLEAMALRSHLIEAFKLKTWGHCIESYFLKRAAAYEQVVYSLIRTQDRDLATDLYARILEGKQSFAELAQRYSEGPESYTGGVLGPDPIEQPHPAIGQRFAGSQPGRLFAPFTLQGWHIILRLEQRFPASLTTATRRRLLNELFDHWIQAQIQTWQETLDH